MDEYNEIETAKEIKDGYFNFFNGIEIAKEILEAASPADVRKETLMKELKRCPFCGGIAHLDFAGGSNKFYWGTDGFEKYSPLLYKVFCCSCYCETAPTQDPNTAIKMWNRRA